MSHPADPATPGQSTWQAQLSFARLVGIVAVSCAVIVALALPAGAFLLVRHQRGWGRRPEVAASRLRLSLYALLPLLWALMLADHLPLGMAEGGLVLPVSAAPWWPELAGWLPAWSADGHVIAFCQSLVVAVGVAGSVVLLRRLLQPLRWGWLALGWLAVGLGAGGRWLVAG